MLDTPPAVAPSPSLGTEQEQAGSRYAPRIQGTLASGRSVVAYAIRTQQPAHTPDADTVLVGKHDPGCAGVEVLHHAS